MTPEQYCQDKTNASGSSFYHTFRFLSKQRRLAITALYAFCREVDDVVDECTEYDVAQVKLNWWKDEIQNLFDKRPIHPVTKALLPHIEPYQLSHEYFSEIIDGMEMDLKFNRYEDFSQLQLYCYRVASVVGYLSAQIFGYQDRNTLNYAHDLGIAFQLTNIIRDVGEDARRNRIYLPLDELANFGVTESMILNCQETDAISALMKSQIERAETFYDKALNQLPAIDKKSQQPGLMMAAIYRTLLREIAAEGPEKVLNTRTSLGTLHKLRLAFSVWRKH